MSRFGMHRVWPRLEARAMQRFWRRMARAAEDRTEDLARRSCVILAPHPDDETLGCGGLALRKRAAGADVSVIMATDGAATHAGQTLRSMSRDDLVGLREAETLAACDALGIAGDRVHFLRFPDGALAAHEDALADRLAGLVAGLAPEEVYVCARSDGHRDHVALARAARALAQAGRLGGATLWEYPVWTWDFRSWRPEGTTNKRGFVLGVMEMRRMARATRVCSVSIEGVQEAKRAALAHHRSQLGMLEGEPGWDGLPETFLSFFFRDRELFFAVDAGTG